MTKNQTKTENTTKNQTQNQTKTENTTKNQT